MTSCRLGAVVAAADALQKYTMIDERGNNERRTQNSSRSERVLPLRVLQKSYLPSDYNIFFGVVCGLDPFLNPTSTVFFSYQAHLMCRKAVIAAYGFTSYTR